MIDAGHPKLAVSRQCSILGISRSYLYYTPKETATEELELMRRIDKIHTDFPFFGSRQMVRYLGRRQVTVNRKRAQRLMKKMGLRGMVPGPDTSRPHPEHIKYPYLLRNLAIVRPDQVWATDITYIPMAKGFLYLVAVIDWYSRRVLSWRLSNTLEPSFCVEALLEAFAKFGVPEIFNTDQGAQFTSYDFIKELQDRGIEISMDGKGRALDNVFVERLWRSLKYEYIYLNPEEDGLALRKGLSRYFEFFNGERPHSSFDGQTPDEVYFGKSDDLALGEAV